MDMNRGSSDLTLQHGDNEMVFLLGSQRSLGAYANLLVGAPASTLKVTVAQPPVTLPPLPPRL